MNSTDEENKQAALRDFFERKLLPLAERLKLEGHKFFPMAPDVQAESYYIRRMKRTMLPEDFTALGSLGTEEIEVLLAQMWQEQGYHELARLAVDIAHLAGMLRATESQSAEVSELIYVMF
jgi:hypothetical protein